jgi:hypothetical protein
MQSQFGTRRYMAPSLCTTGNDTVNIGISLPSVRYVKLYYRSRNNTNNIYTNDSYVITYIRSGLRKKTKRYSNIILHYSETSIHCSPMYRFPGSIILFQDPGRKR